MSRTLPLLLALASSCAAPSTEDVFVQFRVEHAQSAVEVREALVSIIDAADTTLDVALPVVHDTDLAQAVVDAHLAGVEVRAITDIDQLDDPGTQLLLDAGVPLTLADDGIAYFDFNILRDVAWSSDQTIMSHAYAIADRRRAVVSTEAGSLIDGSRIVTHLQGEDVLRDLWTEHNQVFGGSDAVAVTAFDNMAKSIAHYRWIYPTQTDQKLEMAFGPQQRVVKQAIDASYAAKASIRVLTDDFSNKGMSDALKDKAAMGFDVEVIVGPNFGASAFFLSQELAVNTPGVTKHRICDDVAIPTLILIDYEPARNGLQYPSRAMYLTHDLYAALRLFRDDEVLSDQMIDGTLLAFNDYDEPSGVMLDLLDIYESHLERATSGLECP